MPILKLRKHQANFSDEDILISPADYNGLRLNDVVELKSPKGENPNSRILLQVRKWPETTSYPNSVSIKDSILNTHLKLYADVLVNIVDKKDVLVDSIEICFSNAYLARSYMWGLRNHLNNRCVYQRQKLDYLHIRSQLCELWAQGNKVTSGYVDDDTKIVFRSASSLVYLFIQMSSEMWDYDINGDLYCEKAINGFLTDLFETWRRNDCSHDITIILFSRTFYDAESLDEFPKEMRECLQVDYKNRFYEDCYRVAFQNDRFDLHDWNAKLTTLKSLFNQYQKEVIDRHQEKYDVKIPRAYNSSAAQGNFLEVLNMSLNVFEKHYFDRSFDRTGQLSVVVSPGVGVFEVDFEMTNLTKQRIIDNGIGSDLVCLGEQPLHTVPLLKFNSKSSPQNDNLATCDVYNMPHWINLSFYSSQNQVFYCNFIPRIKLPTIHNQLTKEVSKCTIADNQNGNLTKSTCQVESPNIEEGVKEKASHGRQGPYFNNHPSIPDFLDYDEYDDQVFKPNSTIKYHCLQPTSRGEKTVLSNLDSNMDYLTDNDDDFMDRNHRNRPVNVERRSSDVKSYQDYCRNMRRQQISENLPITQPRVSPQVQNTFTRMSLFDSYLTDIKIKPESADDLSVRGYNVQSRRMNRSSARPKALINPFDPSHMTIKLTPNRRRWTHVFPQGPTGTFIQQHHYQPVPQKSALPYLADVSTPPILENETNYVINNMTLNGIDAHCSVSKTRVVPSAQVRAKLPEDLTTSSKRWADNMSMLSPKFSRSNALAGYNKSALVSNDTVRFAWCASGEQEWTPAITTGVDWKSLTMPACLPLTTDFFPSKTSLQNDYVIGEYTIDSSCIHQRYTLIEVYRELVCQRLQKGFQIILLPRKTNNHTDNHSLNTSRSSIKHRSIRSSPSSTVEYDYERERTEYTMSIGRIFHKLSLDGNTITVTQYRPRHPYPTIKIDYCYRFRAPFHDTYIQSWVHFKSEKLENYSWNYLDNYICARGESFELRSSLKFWRFRILILPSRLSLRKITDRELSHRHDVHYLEYSDEERRALMDSFIKLLEIINKTRRASATRLSSSSHSSTSLNSVSANQVSPNQAIKYQQQQQHQLPKQTLTSSSPTRLNVHISDLRSSESLQDASEREDSRRKLELESINMDIDSALRDARRAEWVHVQYHCFFDIKQAFELVIKWMVASGAGIAEMVQGWSRKAGNSSVHVVPIPWEPFALPHSGKADPLRCPIGIQLRLDCLPDCNTLDDNQVIRLQELILRRFGFLRFHDLISSENIERQFVHLSGFAFVALPNIINDESKTASVNDTTTNGLTEEDNGDNCSDNLKRNRCLSEESSLFSPLILNGDIQPTLTSQKSATVVVSSTIGSQIKQSQVQTQQPQIATANTALTTTATASDIAPFRPKSSSASSGQDVKSLTKSKSLALSLKLEHQDTISSPREEYITRHISGARQNKASRVRGENELIEFIWSWNYMLTKRWRSTSTQDESYAVSLMHDFKDFCQNEANRLVEFWAEVKELL